MIFINYFYLILLFYLCSNFKILLTVLLYFFESVESPVNHAALGNKEGRTESRTKGSAIWITKAALLLSLNSYLNLLNVCIFMCLLPEGPPPISCSPAPGLLFPAPGASCQPAPSLSLGRALSFFFTQLQRSHREVPLPLAHQTCPVDPRDRGVLSGTTSAPSLRTSCTSQACSLSSPLFFFFLHSSSHPAITYSWPLL